MYKELLKIREKEDQKLSQKMGKNIRFSRKDILIALKHLTFNNKRNTR